MSRLSTLETISILLSVGNRNPVQSDLKQKENKQNWVTSEGYWKYSCIGRASETWGIVGPGGYR